MNRTAPKPAPFPAELPDARKARYVESFGLSLSADDKSDLRARMVAAFDRFVDVRGMPDGAVVRWLRENEIDILVAVAGYMGEWR